MFHLTMVPHMFDSKTQLFQKITVYFLSKICSSKYDTEMSFHGPQPLNTRYDFINETVNYVFNIIAHVLIMTFSSYSKSVFKFEPYSWKQRPILQRFYELITEILWQTFWFNLDSNNSSMSQFHTCHDISDVVACAKLWHDLIRHFLAISTYIFIKFGLWAHGPSVKCVPIPWGLDNVIAPRPIPAI